MAKRQQATPNELADADLIASQDPPVKAKAAAAVLEPPPKAIIKRSEIPTHDENGKAIDPFRYCRDNGLKVAQRLYRVTATGRGPEVKPWEGEADDESDAVNKCITANKIDRSYNYVFRAVLVGDE